MDGSLLFADKIGYGHSVVLGYANRQAQGRAPFLLFALVDSSWNLR
jgi:hypothetical protein